MMNINKAFKTFLDFNNVLSETRNELDNKLNNKESLTTRDKLDEFEAQKYLNFLEFIENANKNLQNAIIQRDNAETILVGIFEKLENKAVVINYNYNGVQGNFLVKSKNGKISYEQVGFNK